MEKYKDPYQYYYNPYSVPDNNENGFGYGNYGYRRNEYSPNRYNTNSMTKIGIKQMDIIKLVIQENTIQVCI